jgi:hypothetical protein
MRRFNKIYTMRMARSEIERIILIAITHNIVDDPCHRDSNNDSDIDSDCDCDCVSVTVTLTITVTL